MTETRQRQSGLNAGIATPNVITIPSLPAPENTQVLFGGEPVEDPNTYVAIAATTFQPGLVIASGAVRARASSLVRSAVIGIATTAAAVDYPVHVKYQGVVSLSRAQWTDALGTSNGLTPGAQYYLSPTRDGGLTTTVPTAIGTYVVALGIALTAEDLLLLPSARAESSGVLVTQFLVTPVFNSRQWTTALAPNNVGGWNFITQCYNYPTLDPSQWVVDHLETGAYTSDVGPNGIASNTNFQINTALQANGPARAANGRIFFPLSSPSDNQIRMAYYEPATEHVVQLPNLMIPGGNTSSAVFSFVFNHTGSLCYGGTQAQIGSLACLFSLDPVTLAETVLGLVGVAPSTQPKYAYYLAKDEAPGAAFLYCAVGQDPWELVSLDVGTGVQTVLHTTSGPGQQFISFDALANGWRVQIIDNGVSTYYWLADGAITAYPGSGAPPGGARAVTPFENPVVNPPDVNYNLGAGFVAWRPNGSIGDFTVNSYVVTDVEPIPIETLITPPASAGVAVLGNTLQYNGFWKWKTDAAILTWYGPGELALLSQPALLDDAPLMYMAGYANGALYRYVPSADWTPLDVGPAANPILLGNFHDTGSFMKYCYFLERSTNGKIYAVGRRERDGDGSGVGSYDIASHAFTGNVNAPLPDYYPRGWLVLDDRSQIVFSGQQIDGVTDAQFLIFDMNLAIIDQQTVRAGVTDSGKIFTTPTSGILIGVAPAAGAVYRYDLDTATMLDWTPQVGAIGTQSMSKAPDGAIYFTVGSVLKKIDPDTFEITTIGTFDVVIDPASSFTTWRGDQLYLANGANLYAVGI
jgi:hypothetical protein